MAFHDNGMAMEVDVKRVNINLENLKVQYDNAQAMQEQQLNLLKYIMDYPADAQIALVPVNSENITPVALTGLSENLYELQLLQSQKVMAENKKDDWLRLHPFIKPDCQLDVLRLYRQSLSLVPLRTVQSLVPFLRTGGITAYSYFRRTG